MLSSYTTPHQSPSVTASPPGEAFWLAFPTQSPLPHKKTPPLCKGRCPEGAEGLPFLLADYWCKLMKNESIPQALRATLRAPRRQSLLHALAKNVPLAHFLYASRPLHKGAFGLAFLGQTALPALLKPPLCKGRWPERPEGLSFPLLHPTVSPASFSTSLRRAHAFCREEAGAGSIRF